MNEIDRIVAFDNAGGVLFDSKVAGGGAVSRGYDDGKGNVVLLEWADRRERVMHFKEFKAGEPLTGNMQSKAAQVGARSFSGRYRITCLAGHVTFDHVGTTGGYGVRFGDVKGSPKLERNLRLDEGQSVLFDTFFGPLPDNFGGTKAISWVVGTQQHGTVINVVRRIVKV